MQVAGTLCSSLGCPPPSSCPEVAKLEVAGIGMRSHTSVASRLFQSLAAVGINVDMINTSEMRVNVVVDGSCGQKALEVLKAEFTDALM
jgi:aspartate kinase